MTAALIVPIATPLLAAGLLTAVPGWPALHRAIAVLVNLGVLAVGGRLLAASLDGRVLTQNVGNWPPGFAIVLAADALSALLVCVSALLVLAYLAFAATTGDDTGRGHAPLTLILAAGTYGAFLTADLFNLFVFVEVMLLPSYGLLVAAGGAHRLAAGRIYITVNLFGSTVLLAGIALLYGVTGSVNIGELAGTARQSSAAGLAGAVVLTAMALKAAIVPLHGWLPRTYPHAAPAVTMLFSGLLTKVGVYAIIRIYAVVFDGAAWSRGVIMTAALLTMVVGVLGAVGEQTMRGVLVFHMVSQIGYILLGLALFTLAGLAASIFFLVQYIMVKAALLACAGAVRATYGTDRLDRLGGLARRDRLLAVAFLVSALSLAGLPPMSGFVAKYSLVRAAVIQAEPLAVAVAVVVSLFTLLSMIKLWRGVFWGREPAMLRGGGGSGRPVVRVRPALTGWVLTLAAPSVVLGLGAQPLLAAATAAASNLVNTSDYVRAVSR